MSNIYKRLKAIEKQVPERMILLVDDNGTEKAVTLPEYLANPDLYFIKFISEGSNKEFDLFFPAFGKRLKIRPCATHQSI